MTTPIHNLDYLPCIPQEDRDSEEVCMLSHTPYTELESTKVFQLTCHGVHKYIDPDFFLRYVQTQPNIEALPCLQCREIIRVEAPLLDKIFQAELDKTALRRTELQNELKEIDDFIANTPSTGSKIKDYLFALNQFTEKAYPLEDEILQINLYRSQIKIRQKKLEIDQIPPSSFENTIKIKSLEDELFRLELEKQEAIDAIENLTRSLKKELETLDRAQRHIETLNSDLLATFRNVALASVTALATSFFVPPLATPSIIGALFYAVSKKERIDELLNRFRNEL